MPKILTHKKFQAGLIMSLVIFLGQLFPIWATSGDILIALATINWWEVSAPILTAIGAQGIADWGKEAEKERRNG